MNYLSNYRLKIILAIIISMLLVISIIMYIHNSNISAEEAFYKNTEVFEKNAEKLIVLQDDVDILQKKDVIFGVREDYNHYNLTNSLTLETKNNKVLNEKELKYIKGFECEIILKKLNFSKIIIYDGAIFYVSKAKPFSIRYSNGIMYCNDENKIEYMKSTETKLSGIHISNVKSLKDDFYYVIMD